MSEYIWRCDLSKQYEHYRQEIDKTVGSVLRRGVYTLGKEVELFEKEFAAYIGRGRGIAVASGTDALILALKASGIREGDEVLTSVYAPTPVATAIVLAGGIPVFVDIERETCLIDPGEIDRKTARRARFLIPVHLFGLVCDMAAIRQVARRKGMTIIEDCAQAHGAMLKDKKAGAFGKLACFSFYPTKNLGAFGDGGLVATDSQRLERRLRLLRNYGKRRNPFDSDILGFNSRLDELQASVLRVKLRHLDEMNRKRQGLVRLYKEGLKGMPVAFLEERPGVRPNYHILTILCAAGRDGLARRLENDGIQTNIYYPRPLHMMKAFRKYVRKGERFPISERVSKEALALPLYPEFEKEKALFVIRKIRQYFSTG